MATPLSGQYRRTLQSDTAPTDVAGYGTYHTSAAGVPKYRTAAGVEYAVNPSGPNVITVGTLGDVTTIAAAITAASARTPSAANPVVIFLLPGVYDIAATWLTIPPYVSLIGSGIGNTKITGASTNVMPSMVFFKGSGEIAHFTIENTGTPAGPLPSATINIGLDHNGTVYNGTTVYAHDLHCISPWRDNFVTWGASAITVRDCIITGTDYDTLSVNVPTNYTHTFLGCTVENTDGSAKCLWINGGGKGYFKGCTFKNVAGNGIINWDHSETQGDFGDPSILQFEDCTFLQSTGLPGTVTGTVSAAPSGGTAYLDNCSYDVTGSNASVTHIIGKTHGGSIDGTETRWRDFSAVAWAGGFMSDDGSNAWNIDSSPSTAIVSTVDTQSCYFVVPYEPGTIITKIRVRWLVATDNDGLKFRLVKRDESGTTTTFTTVGAQQTVTDTTPYAVTVSTYTLPSPETMADNTSYQIEILSTITGATSLKLYSVGIETSKRVY
jgi:hypothetical protein